MTEPITSSNSDIIEIDFREIWLKVFKHRQTIISSVLICVLLALVYSFVARPVYESTTRLLVEGEPPKIVKVGETIVPDYTDHESFFNSQVEVLSSHAVASLVYDELGTYEPWGMRGKNPAHLKEMGRDELIDAMIKNVKITPVKMTDIIEIGVEDPNPELAARIANLWTRAYIIFSSTDQLIEQRAELEQDLDQQYKYYKEKHPVIQGLKSQIVAVNDAIADERKRMFEDTSSVDHFSFSTNDSITNVKVLDSAVVPTKPERPKKFLILALSLFVGGFIGFGLMFLFESLDQSIKTPNDIEHLLKISFLTSIPVHVDEANPQASPELMTMTAGHSSGGEAFRSLRTNILYSNPDLKKKIFVVTSTMPGEGKTTVAVNLATAFAQVEEKTLIIDADLRNPKLHYLFNLKRENGVTEVLSMENADVNKFIYKTKIPNLSVLNCGALPPNPSELLGSKKMQALLEKLSGMYDRIILDTPPVLAATDAVVLSAKTDGVIFVVKAGSTPGPAAIRSLNNLLSVHANIFGAVLNMVKPKEHGDYHYYYHYSQDTQKSKSR